MGHITFDPAYERYRRMMQARKARRSASGGLLALLLVASSISGVPPGSGARVEAQDDRSDPRSARLLDPGTPSFDTDGWRTDFGISSVPFSEIASGGLPRDGIAAIEAPRFESVEAAGAWLDGSAPVIALEIDGDARAYPLAILVWHEIVNDTLSGVPVVVSFCPLCNTALTYDRSLDGVTHDFRVTGMLRFSDLIMYDRRTETWWQQATGRAIVGELTGSRLGFRSSQIISLDQFAETWPEGLALSRDTGHDRPYGDNPYTGYDSVDDAPFTFSGQPIEGIAPKERVVTVGEGRDGIAFPHSSLRAVGAIEEVVEGEPIVVFWEPRVSRTEDGVTFDGEAVGSTGVFSPFVDGRRLTFARGSVEDAAIVDAQTGSTWAVTGRAIKGPLVGASLQAIPHGNHFWFAWVLFTPETRVWSAGGTTRLGGAD